MIVPGNNRAKAVFHKLVTAVNGPPSKHGVKFLNGQYFVIKAWCEKNLQGRWLIQDRHDAIKVTDMDVWHFRLCIALDADYARFRRRWGWILTPDWGCP